MKSVKKQVNNQVCDIVYNQVNLQVYVQVRDIALIQVSNRVLNIVHNQIKENIK